MESQTRRPATNRSVRKTRAEGPATALSLPNIAELIGYGVSVKRGAYRGARWC